MAKQKKPIRRVQHSTTPRTFSDGQPTATAPVAPAETATPRTNGAASSVRPVAPGFRRRAAAGSETRPQLPLSQEYHYVLGDLRRLGILAGSMVALMIVLGLILH